MANEKKNNQFEEKAVIEKEKQKQKNQQINNQEEYGTEENLNEFKKKNNIVSERTAWN